MQGQGKVKEASNLQTIIDELNDKLLKSVSQETHSNLQKENNEL